MCNLSHSNGLEDITLLLARVSFFFFFLFFPQNLLPLIGETL